MDPGTRLSEGQLNEVDPGSALQFRVLELQRLVAELLQKNQELRQALAKAGAGPSSQV
jgi:hypothetical protein